MNFTKTLLNGLKFWIEKKFSKIQTEINTKQPIGNYVTSVEGKGLSTEDYTTEEKNALQNIADTFVSKEYVDEIVPAKVSELENDADYATVDDVDMKITEIISLPDGASVNQMLVTDTDGTIMWADKEFVRDKKYVLNYDILDLGNYLKPDEELSYISHVNIPKELELSYLKASMPHRITFGNICLEAISGSYQANFTINIPNTTTQISLTYINNRLSISIDNWKDAFPNGFNGMRFKIEQIIERPPIKLLDESLISDDIARVKDVPIVYKDVETLLFTHTLESKPDRLEEEILVETDTSIRLSEEEDYIVTIGQNRYPVFASYSSLRYTLKDKYGVLDNLPITFICGKNSVGSAPYYMWVRIYSEDIEYPVTVSLYRKDRVSLTISETYMPTTIPVIQSATVGQSIAIKSIDENGKPTEWETVDPWVITSSTEGSTKQFRLTIDDEGVLTATEIE